MVAAECDLGGPHQTGAGTFKGIDITLCTSGIETDPLKDFLFGDIGSDGQGEPVCSQDIESIALESEFQQYRSILQVVELRAADLRCSIEIDQMAVPSVCIYLVASPNVIDQSLRSLGRGLQQGRINLSTVLAVTGAVDMFIGDREAFRDPVHQGILLYREVIDLSA